MKVEIEKNKKLATSLEIQQLEELIGSAIPEDYKQFLLNFNGGYVENNMFHADENNEIVGVRYFLGINTKNDTDVYKALEVYKNRVPLKFLPIGADGSGNLFCLSLRSKDYNTVYFWDHELEDDEDEPPTENNLFKLADNFNELLEGLEPFDISVLDNFPTKVEVVFANIDFLKAHGADPKVIEELERKQNNK